MGWRSTWRHYFIFNRRERRGLYVLTFILIVILGARLSLSSWVTQETSSISDEEWSQLVQQLEQKRNEPLDEESSFIQNPNVSKEISWVSFDPNLVTEEELINLGLPKWLAKRTINYRTKVAPFQDASDLLKVYDMDTNWLEQALPHITIAEVEEQAEDVLQPSAQVPKAATASNGAKPKTILFNLNRADTNDLKQIPGIGSYYARSVVAYRERLGGYFSYAQLLEVKYMKEETLEALVQYTLIDSTDVACLNMNVSDIKALGMHPYLSWSQAKAVVNYRKHHGDFKDKKDLMRTRVVSESDYLKIAPYLCQP